MFPLDMGPVDPCRTITVPNCDPPAASSDGQVPAIAQFALGLRDQVDFTVDFSAWQAANGNPVLSSATFAVAAQSPKQPIVIGQGFSQQGKATVVIAPAVGAVAQDAYYLDVTAMFDPVPADVSTPPIGARKLVRRIHVVVGVG